MIQMFVMLYGKKKIKTEDFSIIYSIESAGWSVAYCVKFHYIATSRHYLLCERRMNLYHFYFPPIFMTSHNTTGNINLNILICSWIIRCINVDSVSFSGALPSTQKHWSVKPVSSFRYIYLTGLKKK